MTGTPPHVRSWREWYRTVGRIAVEAPAHPPPGVAYDEVRDAVARWRANECNLIVPRGGSW
jgi:hypothetical protein